MKISVPCPESVRIYLSNEDANNHPAEGIKIEIDGGLLSVELAGETREQRLESLRDFDGWIGLAIADDDRPRIIHALSQLKATVLGLHAIVVRESSYTVVQQDNAPEQVEEATDADAISQLQGEQHTSSEGSSEQHGAVTEQPNEENVNVEAQQEEQRPRRRRAAGRE